MKLTNNQIGILNSLCGTGDHHYSDVLFFGNEEGFGNNPVANVINVRIKYFVTNTPLIGTNKLDGHFYIDNTGTPYPINSPFLNFSARLMLYLGNPNGNWFVAKPKDPDYNLIREYIKNRLFREQVGLKSGLFELRPLPRKNESTWPYIPNNNIIEQEYNKAFRFDPKHIPDQYHQSLRDQRLKVLKNIFEYSSAKIFIGVGAKEYKRIVIETMYPDIKFKEQLIGNVSCYYAQYCINNRNVNIYLCSFFGYRGNGIVKLNELSALAILIYKQSFN